MAVRATNRLAATPANNCFKCHRCFSVLVKKSVDVAIEEFRLGRAYELGDIVGGIGREFRGTERERPVIVDRVGDLHVEQQQAPVAVPAIALHRSHPIAGCDRMQVLQDMRRLDDEGLALPASHRESCQSVRCARRRRVAIQMDLAPDVEVLVMHDDLVVGLDDLHRTRQPGELPGQAVGHAFQTRVGFGRGACMRLQSKGVDEALGIPPEVVAPAARRVRAPRSIDSGDIRNLGIGRNDRYDGQNRQDECHRQCLWNHSRALGLQKSQLP